MNYGPGLTCYGDRLYFTGYQEEADVQGSGWNNTVFYYDLDTGEQGALLPVESLVGVLSVYKDCLYVQNFAVDGGYQFYDGYRLDRDGNILEKKRYLLPLPGRPDLTIEMDVFEGVFSGLILAEVEFKSEEDALSFTPPEWFGRDVTWSGEYQNSRLSIADPASLLPR